MTFLELSGTTLIVALLGVVLLVGFGADLLAARFRIPDVLWLIALGLIAGPVLGLVSTSSLLLIAPILGTTALLLILFDAGIDLQLSLVGPIAASAILFAILSYAVSSVTLFIVGDLFLFPGHAVTALLFGTALGCASGAVIIPLANRLGLMEGLRSFLHLDAAVEDALAVLTVTTLLIFVVPGPTPLAVNLTTTVLLPLPVGIAIGLVAGLLWLLFLYRRQGDRYATLATLGFLFVVYAVADALSGSTAAGILSALVFGAVLGNERIVRRFLRRRQPFRVTEEFRRVEVEIAFVLRAFFLFLIGSLVVLVFPTLAVAVVLIALPVVLLALRRVISTGATDPRRIPSSWTAPVADFYGRGLTSAVLLIVALETAFKSSLSQFSLVLFPAVLLIVGTNVVMTVRLLWSPPHALPAESAAERQWEEISRRLIALTDLPVEPLASSDGPGPADGSAPSAPSVPTDEAGAAPPPAAETPERPPLPRPRDPKPP